MKSIAYIFVVMLLFIECSSSAPPDLTADYLLHAKFDSITFTERGKFQFRPDINDMRGQYTVVHKSVILDYEGTARFRRQICQLEKSRSPWYRTDLVCDDGRAFPLLTTQLPAGQKVSVGPVPAITMGLVQGRTLDDVILRTGPSTGAPPIEFHQETGFSSKYAPKDSPLIFLARTTERDQVQTWNNYWYYVDVIALRTPEGLRCERPGPSDAAVPGGHIGCTAMTGWMFGQFVQAGI